MAERADRDLSFFGRATGPAPSTMCESKTIWWDGGLWLIDQTRLPVELLPLRIKSVRQLIEAIKTLRVRGAPALGAAGAYGIGWQQSSPGLPMPWS